MAIDRVRSSLRRRPEEHRDASIFLVATEGEHTESIYLATFRDPRIKVIPIPCEDGKSSPQGVLDRLSEAMTTFQFGGDDTFWILVDRDSWTERMFSEVNSECKKKNIFMSTSNARFEAFLCWHFDDFRDSEEFSTGDYENFLRKKLGSFSKTKFDAHKLRTNTARACSRAESDHSGSYPAAVK